MKKMLYEKRHVNDLVNYLSIHYPGIFIVICIRMTLLESGDSPIFIGKK